MELASGLITGRVPPFLAAQSTWKAILKKGKENGKEIRTSHACNDSDITELLCPGPLARVFGISCAEFYNLAKVRYGAPDECQAIWKSYFSGVLLVLEERRLLRWEIVRGHVWCGFVDIWRGLESVECAGNGGMSRI